MKRFQWKIITILIIGLFFGFPVILLQSEIESTTRINIIGCTENIEDFQMNTKKSTFDCTSTSLSPIMEKRPLLFILIEFADKSHSPEHDYEYFENILWGDRNSLSDYYHEVSYGTFTYTKAGILGWYKSTYRYKWLPFNLLLIPSQAFKAASQDHSFNFAQYDKNGDQIISYDELSVTIVISASYPRPMVAMAPPWGKKIETWDHVYLSGQFNIVQEWQVLDTFAHELGHTLGAVDLYDYFFFPPFTTGASFGTGNYGLMSDTGIGPRPENPPHFCAWSKIKIGWIDPIVVTQDGYYEIPDIARNPTAYILCNQSHSPEEYFLIANRQPGIHYDLDLPDTGIIIYHIDESGDNDDETHKLVDIECADSPSSHFKNADDLDKFLLRGNKGDSHDLWDKYGYVFHDNSEPCNARWYDGSKSGVVVGVQSESGKTMKVWLSINGNLPL